MVSASLGSIMERLDALDGFNDGSYSDLPLVGRNTTGACLLAEQYSESVRAMGLNVAQNVTLNNPLDVRVPVDCDVLVRYLNAFVNIAQRLPAFKFIADISTGASLSETELPTREDLYGYHIVDHMISSLLQGIATTSQSFSEIFCLIPFKVYTRSVEEIASTIPDMAPGELYINDADGAYDVFEKLGKRYGFDVSVFKPEGHEDR